MSSPKTIIEYIRNEPAPIRKVLKEMRALVAKSAPLATEKLAWGMPTFYLEGNLLHFAAFKNHMSLFPGSDAVAKFKKALPRFESSKGTIQIPYGIPLPAGVIARIVKYCVKRNLAKAEAKRKKKTGKRAS